MTKNLELTIYNGGLGFVKEQRQMELEQGLNNVSFGDVSNNIDPDSVFTKTPQGVSILEQSFEAGKEISREAMLEKAVGTSITLTLVEEYARNQVSGTLLRQNGRQIILQTETGIEFIDSQYVRGLKVSPEVLAEVGTKPSLNWLVNSEEKTTIDVQVNFLTTGLSWSCDYVMQIGKDKKATLQSRITVQNNSGKDFVDAKLNFVAGQVNHNMRRVMAKASRAGVELMDAELCSAAPAGAPVSSENFGDFKLYSLNRTSTVKDGESKQLSFFECANVAVEPRYSFEHGREVSLAYKLANTEENNMGLALPAGTVRMYSEASDGTSHFTGEQNIQNTARNDTLELRVGNAFDLKGNKRETNYEVIESIRTKEHGDITKREQRTYKVVLENQKDEDVTIEVYQALNRNMKFVDDENGFEETEEGSYRFKCDILVPAGQKTELVYVIEAEHDVSRYERLNDVTCE